MQCLTYNVDNINRILLHSSCTNNVLITTVHVHTTKTTWRKYDTSPESKFRQVLILKFPPKLIKSQIWALKRNTSSVMSSDMYTNDAHARTKGILYRVSRCSRKCKFAIKSDKVDLSHRVYFGRTFIHQWIIFCRRGLGSDKEYLPMIGILICL